MLIDLVAPVLPKSLKLQRALEKEICHSLMLSFQDCVYWRSSHSLIDPTLHGWLTWHDPLKSCPVKYILHPSTVVPPREMFGLSDSFILRSEGCLVWFPVTHSFRMIKQSSCCGFTSAQLLAPSRNCPWWDSHPCWTMSVIKGENGLLHNVNSQLCIPNRMYNSWYNSWICLSSLPDRTANRFSWGCKL